MKLKNCNILIYGLGKSGRAALKLLYSEKSRFFLFDDDTKQFENLLGKVKGLDNIFLLNKLTKDMVDEMDLIILSPGVSVDNAILKYAKTKNKRIMGELELGFVSCKNDFLCVTGTNGKTTTVNLLWAIFNQAKKRCSVVGNVGVPVCDKISKETKKDIFVCEVSSFQLESIKNFRPKIASILNIDVDHLDRHKTKKVYAQAKYKIAQNMKKKDCLVLNQNCAVSMKLAPKTRCKIYYFNTEKECIGAYIKDDKVCINIKKPIEIMNVSDIKLVGRHNQENILCAALMAYLYKIRPIHIKQAISEFVLPHHRIEKVDTIGGVTYINDSKATNIGATIAALKAITEPINLILGGSDKGYDYMLLFKHLPSNVIRIAAAGAVGDKIMAAAGEFSEITRVKTLKDAVTLLKNKAQAGEVVLLSPASASFDEFNGYAERGQKFCEYVRANE
ncbi:MAG: UDP-N-acetylmuramoyl-L-alanine--D-glutamate ligase [Christensenellaceae bacterium]|jgi:UDP-N-acetylmuramoylalanine--D-glutamate ligase|nr:UDP-N-acetylmuramoyl-L-alanine--D-glutamate ligase [Christensenellaceae bacterium]